MHVLVVGDLMAQHEAGPMAVFEPIALRPETLSEKVYEAIRDAIVSRRLPPGGRITEASLATQLSVSKTPVREAILRLEHVGLIKADSGKGASVVQASPAIIREAFEYRLALEVEAARLAAARADEAAVEALEDLAENSLSAALARRFRRVQWLGPEISPGDRRCVRQRPPVAGRARRPRSDRRAPLPRRARHAQFRRLRAGARADRQPRSADNRRSETGVADQGAPADGAGSGRRGVRARRRRSRARRPDDCPPPLTCPPWRPHKREENAQPPVTLMWRATAGAASGGR